MSDTKFTEGPWITIENPTNISIATGPYDQGGKQVAFVAGAPSKPFRRANAALLVSAPELYKALEACLAREVERAKAYGYSDCLCINFSRDTEREYENGCCPHQKARAALAKARGETCAS